MTLTIYNSYTKDLETYSFQPGSEVSIYCCGVTVYDHCHIGHGRIYTLLDTLTRYLKAKDLRVRVIRNITDIDDKILNRAKQEASSWQDIASTYTASMQRSLMTLGCLPVTLEPKATEAMDQIIAMIQSLLDKGFAYKSGDEIFFDIEKFEGYGTLSGQKMQELQQGHRVLVHEGKRHPGDFTLWKATTDTQACWDSPFGPGRPGWHIECSAMIAQYTNKPLDFHLGGMDLKFPHHENEIAQSESCTGHALAHCWVHGGFVTVNQEKMSKSLQNFTYLDGILSAIGRNAMRYFYLSTHYRQPLEMIPEKLTQAQNAIRALESTLMEHVPESLTTGKQYDSSIVAALSVDLNTPQALTLFHEAVKNLKKLPQDQRSECAAALYATACDLLGFDFSDNKKILLSDLDDAVQGLIKQRQNAKRDKDFKAADSLRALIATHGYQIVDLADGYDILPIKKS